MHKNGHIVQWNRISSVQSPVMSDSLQLHGLQHARPPSPSPVPGAYPNSCPSSQLDDITNSITDSMEKEGQPRNKPNGQFIYEKGGNNIQCRKDSLFNKWCQENWTATCKRIKLDYSLTSCTKINSKWIKDLNIRPETITFLKENIGSKLFDICLSNMFLMCLSGQGHKSKNKQMGLYQIKKVSTTNKAINNTERPPTDWEKIFANNIGIKGLISNIYKELIQLNIKKQPN